ncbi:hypothetical protein L1987_22008 [Smallanthus sonchifolius]|uniref:Uncharacterized protein n=1 Tax=Smallanthus sonchifolius TaxID=185202 RepID=A0ACB9IF50_9ASTR|nr:hypothetical protein L1987_22008 [Smallanthus sonchifolius]
MIRGVQYLVSNRYIKNIIFLSPASVCSCNRKWLVIRTTTDQRRNRRISGCFHHRNVSFRPTITDRFSIRCKNELDSKWEK